MTNTISRIKEVINKSVEIKQKLLNDDKFATNIEKIADAIIQCYKNGGKVLLCGNGGSAADAQHLAAELSGRFYFDRKPLDAEALHANTSYITAVANDYSFNEIYSRLVKAKGKKGDVLIGISTSGNSTNIINALDFAKQQGMITVGFTGANEGKMKRYCDYLIDIPSSDTARIQEIHILTGHIICELVEKQMFEKK
ncbi:MAG: D-sedoheptulose 7-phosphate isomerase [Bacteroidales bacterium]|nr:D-sedoheptulose 7-phosphate isomerase [Bacteroidales bacterium]